MKRILLIGTGGTIASELTESGLTPELSTEQLLSHIPSISEFCRADCLQILNLDSTNIAPQHWLAMARCIRAHYDDYDGFVLTHGTDTMAYTAAGLSYLIQGSPKPIVLTGAQKPIGFDSTDSKINLEDAFRVASAEMPGVSIVFNGKIILGTRAQKTHSKSFQAFSSINYPVLGVLRDGALLPYIRQPAGLPELPISWTLFDLPYFTFAFDPPIPPGSARSAGMDQVLDNWLCELTGTRRWGALFSLQLDPQATGEQGRLFMLERVLDKIQKAGDVWLATGTELAAWTQKMQ